MCGIKFRDADEVTSVPAFFLHEIQFTHTIIRQHCLPFLGLSVNHFLSFVYVHVFQPGKLL